MNLSSAINDDAMRNTPVRLRAGYTLVVGLGETGWSCIHRLVGSRKRIIAVDSREHPPYRTAVEADFPEIEVRCGRFDTSLFEAAAEIVVSPGVSLREPALRTTAARGVPIIGDIELFARVVDAPVVAITGSNGKSTVASLLAQMAQGCGLRVGVGGNLGPPALSLLGQGHELYVLEVSSFQLDTVDALRPSAAIVLNLSPDHMDRYDSFDAYVAAKQRVLAGDGVVVANLDDPRAARLGGDRRRTIGFSVRAHPQARWYVTDRANGAHVMRDREVIIPTEAIPLPGLHNVANALAAFALGDAIGLDIGAMATALEAYIGLPHRCETVANAHGVRWINDSKGTNVGATVAAIEGMGAHGTLVLIAGGVGKGADFSPLLEPVARHVRCAVLIGRDATRLGEVLHQRVEVRCAPDLAAAVDIAAAVTDDGDSVLFSPACASFDMFENFEARGDAFRRLVLARLEA